MKNLLNTLSTEDLELNNVSTLNIQLAARVSCATYLAKKLGMDVVFDLLAFTDRCLNNADEFDDAFFLEHRIVDELLNSQNTLFNMDQEFGLYEIGSILGFNPYRWKNKLDPILTYLEETHKSLR